MERRCRGDTDPALHLYLQLSYQVGPLVGVMIICIHPGVVVTEYLRFSKSSSVFEIHKEEKRISHRFIYQLYDS